MTYLILFFIFLLGLTIGSFINCLIWRLHKEENIWGRSYCPRCRKKIAWHDNIPVLSFILLLGRCRSCKKRISWQYPVVEMVTGVLFVMTVICNLKFEISGDYINLIQITNYQLPITIIKDWFLISVMIIVFIYDLRWYLILDIITLPACIIVFIFNLMLGNSLWILLISGIIGSSFFLLQFIISRGKWIGAGDIRLGLLMGLALGWPSIILAIFLAYFIGSIIGLGLIISGKKQWNSQIPLGVFLSTATVIVLFYGEVIINWYFSVLN